MITITKWNETFENADTRKRQRLGWLGVPTGCDSNGYLSLVAEDGGFEAFGIFLAICQWSATQKKEVRGKLIRSNGEPLTEKDIAVRIRAEACQVSAALKLLKSKHIGWITDDSPEKSASDLPEKCQSFPGFVQGEGEGEGEVKGEGEGDRADSGESSPDAPASDLTAGELMDQLWSAAPEKGRRRSSRRQLGAAWAKLKASERPDAKTLLAAIDAWTQCEDWTKDNGEFVPAIHRWVERRKWESLPETQPTRSETF